ncbi:MAG: hypothetical protein EOP34_06095 [Rickettsiales bacterium]|nr:MAG: hypothetical protein EOP34_06095 [Rickettsiales bacterium]
MQHLGGKNSPESKFFKNELHVFYDKTRDDYSFKKSIILEQIKRKDGFEQQLRSFDSSVYKTFTDQLQ